jgi:hypothetical protein
MTTDFTFETHGFGKIESSEGMTNAAAYTKDCSGGRSDCCTGVVARSGAILVVEGFASDLDT